MRFKIRQQGLVFRLRNIQLRDITEFDEERLRRLVRSRNRSPSTPYQGSRDGWRRS